MTYATSEAIHGKQDLHVWRRPRAVVLMGAEASSVWRRTLAARGVVVLELATSRRQGPWRDGTCAGADPDDGCALLDVMDDWSSIYDIRGLVNCSEAFVRAVPALARRLGLPYPGDRACAICGDVDAQRRELALGVPRWIYDPEVAVIAVESGRSRDFIVESVVRDGRTLQVRIRDAHDPAIAVTPAMAAALRAAKAHILADLRFDTGVCRATIRAGVPVGRLALTAISISVPVDDLRVNPSLVDALAP